MISEHSAILTSHLNAGPQWGRILFSLLCAERLRPCCWAFEKAFDRDVSAFESGCNELFEYLWTGKTSRELHSPDQ